jgi:serine/threonine protein kinase
MTTSDPFGIAGTIVDGRYRVERLAGQGGFGVVYRAYHLAFESPIALKILKLPEHWSPERRKARIQSFQREGRMLFELSALHPSIVRAFETGTLGSPDGSPAPYLALEWLDGVSLEQELKHRRKRGLSPMTLPEVLKLLHEPAQALARAHARGVAHRDVKPGNLFVTVRGGVPEVKILDFGIAKIVDEAADTTAQYAATSGATASFTPMYAAPEQWLERLGATGSWTDVHALSLVCVELLTGAPPLRGREPAQFMASCLEPGLRPTPGQHGVALSREVEAVFARAVALNPRERYRDVGSFWQALTDAAEWSPADVGPSVELVSFGAETAASASAAPTGMPLLASSPSTTAATASLVGARAARRLGRRAASGWSWVAWALVIGGAIAYFGRTASQSELDRVVASGLSRALTEKLAQSIRSMRIEPVSVATSTSLDEPEMHVPTRTAQRAARLPEPMSSSASPPDERTSVVSVIDETLGPAPPPETQADPDRRVNFDDPGLTRRK